MFSKQLGSTLEKVDLVQCLSQTYKIFEFQLGDSIVSLPASSKQNGDEQSVKNLYIVCKGRVRLLSFDAERQREVSTQLLTEEETFGGDSLFCEDPLPYRAIAASQLQVAQVPLDQLQKLEELLEWQENSLVEAAQHRQCLIFIKSATTLRSLPSSRLQQLSFYLQQQRIDAGEYLAQATPSEAGRFWLRSGEIQTNSQTLEVGSDWGYPEEIPADWVAQTDLWVYHLPKQNWEAANFGQHLQTQAQNASNGHQKGAAATSPPSNQPPVTPSPRNRDRVPQPETPTIQPQTDTPAIEFPKPLKRRQGLGRGYPFVKQHSASDCGAACLAMVTQYWGKRLSINSIRNLAGIGRAGASLNGLAKAGESLGYRAKPVRASLSSLIENVQGKPWIAHWQGDHYVVVYRIKGDQVLIADPAQGKRRLTRADFLTGWTGYALLLEATENLRAIESEKRSLGTFFRALIPYRSLIIQIIIASLLIQVFALVTPMFTQIILDQVVINKSFTTLHVFAVGLLIFGLWRVGMVAVRQYLLAYFANRVNLTLISGFINHTLRLPLRFFESRHVGDITTRVQENETIQQFLTQKAITAWLDALMGIVYLGLMFYYNWKLTLLVLGIIPPLVILTLGATPFLRKVSREIFHEDAKENSSLIEMITGVDTVKGAAVERESRWFWENNLTGMLNSRFRGQKLGITLEASGGLINTIGNTALLWYGAILVIQGELTIGQFVAFNMLIGYVISPIMQVVNIWDELQEVLISVERLNDVFSTKPEESPQNPMQALPPLRGDVRLENVTFRYDTEEEHNTLQNISFEVEAGQTIAIVGRSGSGKSTLVKLLQGLYQPTNGSIWIDGHDINHVSPQSLRSQLGVVPQECFLFSGTISENITLRRFDYTQEQVVEVAKLAEAHPFIQSMPLGYNTKVGERGSTLSGGQRQRIAIARALLGAPQILILDEATSSLDTESERRFQRNLARLSRDRTTFIIAHRLSTVRNADCILVLDQGVLAEKGTHEELMAKGEEGLYYQIAQQQLDL
ncbi:MAG: peptidase C39 [Cyanobacteria bacterium QS_6_48_18]|nr:MAG: peptidase C39 [Cyanobacteria bacterium QS_6_48_18]